MPEEFLVRRKRTAKAVQWKPGLYPEVVHLYQPPKNWNISPIGQVARYVVKTAFGHTSKIQEGDYLILHNNGCVTVCADKDFDKRFVKVGCRENR